MALILIGIILCCPLLLVLSFFFDSTKGKEKSDDFFDENNIDHYDETEEKEVVSLYEYTATHTVIDELSPLKQAVNRLYAAVAVLNPYFSHWTNKDLENAGFESYEEQYWILFYAKQGVQTSIEEMCGTIIKEGVSFSDRRSIIHNMFKLAKIGDGIRDDEWELIMKVLSELKMNDANTSYLQRLYWNCRNKYSLGFYFARIINELLELSPISERKKSIVSSFYKHFFPNEVGAIGAVGEPIDDISLKEAVKQIKSEVDLLNRRIFMRMLYQLAVENDGIKYDEWLLLGFLLDELDLQEYTDYFKRHYGALRTECDRSEIYRRFSTKYGSTGRQQSQSSSNKKSKTAKVVSSLGAAYEVLELTPSASKEEVQEAYHRLALLHHPDLPRNVNRRAESVRMMAKINEAYTSVIESLK